jgi:hypothetical protein
LNHASISPLRKGDQTGIVSSEYGRIKVSYSVIINLQSTKAKNFFIRLSICTALFVIISGRSLTVTVQELSLEGIPLKMPAQLDTNLPLTFICFLFFRNASIHLKTQPLIDYRKLLVLPIIFYHYQMLWQNAT